METGHSIVVVVVVWRQVLRRWCLCWPSLALPIPHSGERHIHLHAVPGSGQAGPPRALCETPPELECMPVGQFMHPSRSAAPPGFGPLETTSPKMLSLLGTPLAMGCGRVNARCPLRLRCGGTLGNQPSSCHFVVPAFFSFVAYAPPTTQPCIPAYATIFIGDQPSSYHHLDPAFISFAANAHRSSCVILSSSEPMHPSQCKPPFSQPSQCYLLCSGRPCASLAPLTYSAVLFPILFRLSDATFRGVWL